MLVAVEGCAHGELEQIYDCLEEAADLTGQQIELLICCGDFQATRNNHDLCSMAVPSHHRRMCSFYKYYSGERVAPVLTIFIGGNHEASNYMQELPYGGWVAPNIYYLGYAGVINVAGIRIAGLSGIYKGHDYYKGHYEISPYTDNTMRSVYHIRQLEVFRLKQLSGEITIGLSHDWPRNAVEYGDVDRLLKFKPYFREDIDDGKLGSIPAEEVLLKLKPIYWFAGHLHCHYPALIPHENTDIYTKFLALDKCLPKRRFLQVLDIPHVEFLPIELNYDLEWLTILHITNHLLSVKPYNSYMPSSTGDERFNFTPTETERNTVLKMMGGNLVIPLNFEKNVEAFDPSTPNKNLKQRGPVLNTQTIQLCERLKIDDPISLILLKSGNPLPLPSPAKNDSAASSTFLEDTKTFNNTNSFICSPSPLSLPKPRFSLPEPRNTHEEISLDDDEDNDDDDDKEKEEKYNDLSENSLITNQSSELKTVNTPENNSADPVDMICSTPMTGKKPFKRRNESLYSNDGDE